MRLSDYNSLVQIEAADDTKLKQAIQELKVAVGYVEPDGTQKLCGDRCVFHVEDGKYKNRCTILGPNVEVPNVASCSYYLKGEPANEWQESLQPVKPVQLIKPEDVGLVKGKVQCKRCIRSDGNGICTALSKVLQTVYGMKNAQFKIEGDACCNWNKAKGQTSIASK